MTARTPRRKPTARERLATVELPEPVTMKLTAAQMKALAPLFAAARADCDGSGGLDRGAIYAQPYQSGVLRAGYFRPQEATRVHALINQIVSTRPATLGRKGGKR